MSSGTQTNTHVINAMMIETSRRQIFELFSYLPKELRLEIWEIAIPAERLIRISLKPHEGRRYELATAEPRYLQKNSLGKPISGERYRAVVEGSRLNSKFLCVSREAREAALSFYRVHIPAYLTGPGCTARTMLYFNPEHDMLHIEADAPVKETLIDFIWDLKAYDPRGVGLLKLATDLESFCANDLQYLKKSDLLLIRHRTALVETLSQLQEVWFVNVQASSGRGRKCRAPEITSAALQSDRTVPVRGGGPTFQRLGRDAREGLEEELGHMYMGDIDPREILFRWRRVLRTWGVEHEPERVSYRLLVAKTPDWRGRPWQVDEAELHGAVDHLALGRGGDRGTAGGQEGRDGKLAGRSNKRVAAVGFWLFPLEAIGVVGEGDKLSDMDFHPSRVLDMRDYWPELVLSRCC